MQKYKWVPLCSDFFCFAILCSFLYYEHNCRYYIITNPCLSNELGYNYWFCFNVIMIIMNGGSFVAEYLTSFLWYGE